MATTIAERQGRTIASLEERLEQIALLPSVVARLVALDLRSPAAADEIVTLVRNDPPLALRLMKLANAKLPSGSKINTIPGALLRIGTGGIAKMIFALSVIEVFVPHTKGQRNLWIHSIQAALAAQRLAVLRPDLGLQPEECFLAGLLHDIGRFVIFEHRPQELAQIDEADVADPRMLVAAELQACGFDHAALGYEVCRRWQLPESVCEMVKSHHQYGHARRLVPPEVVTLVQLVQEADCFSFGLLRNPASSFHSDAERNKSIEASLQLLSASERLLPTDKLAKELAQIDQEARAAAAIINIAYS
jgi:putative nucleotidyltransferase with HDIG domain